ncbi:MAG: tRNA 2-thiouridine(34) synthase MnmA [Desulfobulbus propionicus]|nr:MAG: tRNA 2-thiouridine(34) synthase MnmA [Desulfobulbus propionicus]
MNQRIKAGIALSGGIDSTVAAILMQEKGYDVHGFFMQLPLPDLQKQTRLAARRARQLDIPLHLVDLREQFHRHVITYLLTTYNQGLTPNPCVICNKKIKGNLLLDAMHRQGMELCATGHYAILKRSGSKPVLARARDTTKDQSYFLCRLPPKQLACLVFPLGHWLKRDVYQKAAQTGFDFPEKESQDVCFLNGDLRSFLQEYGCLEKPGSIIGPAGQRLGTHKGVAHYTIGQRKGLGLPDATPWYVTGIDIHSNQVKVGKESELFTRSLSLSSLHWFARPASFPWEGKIQLRSTHKPAWAQLDIREKNKVVVTFKKAQRAITPGQFAAFYEKDTLIGSGIIEAGTSRALHTQ